MGNLQRNEVYLTHDSGDWKVQDWAAAPGEVFKLLQLVIENRKRAGMCEELTW